MERGYGDCCVVTVLRVVANIAADRVADVATFYSELFGLDKVMDLGWVVTLASRERALAQISFLSEGGSGAPVPDISIEVDDVDEVYERARRFGCQVVRKIANEPWGVRRFFIVDPTGKLLNILSHRT